MKALDLILHFPGMQHVLTEGAVVKTPNFRSEGHFSRPSHTLLLHLPKILIVLAAAVATDDNTLEAQTCMAR